MVNCDHGQDPADGVQPMTSFPRPNYRPILSPRQLAALERERVKRAVASVRYHLTEDSPTVRAAILQVVQQYS